MYKILRLICIRYGWSYFEIITDLYTSFLSFVTFIVSLVVILGLIWVITMIILWCVTDVQMTHSGTPYDTQRSPPYYIIIKLSVDWHWVDPTPVTRAHCAVISRDRRRMWCPAIMTFIVTGENRWVKVWQLPQLTVNSHHKPVARRSDLWYWSPITYVSSEINFNTTGIHPLPSHAVYWTPSSALEQFAPLAVCHRTTRLVLWSV